MKAIWADYVSGSLSVTIPATNAGQVRTMYSDGLKRLPSVVDGVSRAKITLDPFAEHGPTPELVYVTSHAAGSNQAVVQFITGQPLRIHITSEQWVHGPTAEDFNEFQAQLDNQFHTSMITSTGQLIGSTAPNVPAPVSIGTQYQVLTVDTAQKTKLRYQGVPFVVTSITRPRSQQGAYEGMMIYETDTNHVLCNVSPTANGGNGTWHYVDDPPGTVAAYAGSGVPTGWRWCDGTSYDGTNQLYTALFAAIGQQFGGTGNNFNVPDLRSRFVYGWNPAIAGDTTVADARGYKEGTDTLELTIGQLPDHVHGIPNHHHSMAHGHTASNGALDLTDYMPQGHLYGWMAVVQDTAGHGVIQPNNGAQVGFTFMDRYTGNTSDAGAGNTGPGAGTEGDPIDISPRLIRLGYMIRR